MSDQRYAAGVLQGMKAESGGASALMRAFWPEALGGHPRRALYPAGPCEAPCGPPAGYHAPTSQTYGGRRLCLLCAIEARRAERLAEVAA